MFGLKAKDGNMDMNPLAREIEQLRSTMVPPRKPNALQLAERNLAKLRTDRAALAELQRVAITEDYKKGATSPSAQARQLTKEMDALDVQVRGAHQDLAEARKAHGGDFMQAIGPQVTAYGTLLGDLITLLDEAIGVGTDLNNYANRNALPVHRIVYSSPQMHALVRDLRMIVNATKG